MSVVLIVVAILAVGMCVWLERRAAAHVRMAAVYVANAAACVRRAAELAAADPTPVELDHVAIAPVRALRVVGASSARADEENSAAGGAGAPASSVRPR
ncbi:hypothetical protein [Nocardia terpenica]|uniref:hypothetical protein n=1 Tax=Nocardia terpenica TaxID=455432 RepID=UPI0012E7247E|nr:hypothetical protein [Nocardia terpenica]NQE89950.1 hypothetical protein [Nocardia terpenica]